MPIYSRPTPGELATREPFYTAVKAFGTVVDSIIDQGPNQDIAAAETELDAAFVTLKAMVSAMSPLVDKRALSTRIAAVHDYALSSLSGLDATSQGLGVSSRTRAAHLCADIAALGGAAFRGTLAI